MPINFRVLKGGHVEIKPHGYEGETCHEATRPYEERLGGEQSTKEGEAQELATENQAALNAQQQKAGQ